MNHEICVGMATVAGEAGRCGPGSWQAVASSIMNRVSDNKREWKRKNTILEVISKTGYDAYAYKNKAYQDAFNYFHAGFKPNKRLDDLRAAVEPIFKKEWLPYPTIVLYYSPMAMVALNAQNKDRWPNLRPKWDWESLAPVFVPGATQDDMLFFAYK